MNHREREQKSIQRFIIFVLILIFILAIAIYFGFFHIYDRTFSDPFNRSDAVLGYGKVAKEDTRAKSFASDLCVSSTDVPMEGLTIEAASAALFDESEQIVRYAKGLHERRYPASLTKIMTTLVALKYGDLDEMVTVGAECKDIEEGSSVCEIQIGDQLTLRQLLYGLMINSGNDAAMTIAMHVGGTVEHFIELMNEEAAVIGATQTHFTNAHGLQDEDHYTTAYDIYLMFHEALKYEIFQDIISQHTYYATYTNGDGEETGMMWESTNHYFINEAVPPDDVIVYGGKTGTTSDAGACLCLYSKDKYGDPFISIIMKSETRETLYVEMNDVLSKINK